MKVVAILTMALFLASDANAQNPSWQWGHAIGVPGGNMDDVTWSICNDKAGNLIVLGSYQGSMVTIGNKTLTSAGDADVFLAKYDPSGALMWVKSYGGTGTDLGLGVATDDNDNIYISGTFYSPVFFLDSQNGISNNGGIDAYLIKISPIGNYQWNRKADISSAIQGGGVCTDAAGNVYMSVSFSGSFSIGTTTVINSDISGQTWDLCLLKFNGSGNLLWSKREGGAVGNEFARFIAADPSGNLHITGTFSGSVTTVNSQTFANNDPSGTFDIFVARYTAAGGVSWVKAGGGSGYDQLAGIATDPSGNVYVGGYTGSPSYSLGGAVISNTALTVVPVLQKFDNAGNSQWLQSMGTGSASGSFYGVACDAQGYLYASGAFMSPALSLGGATFTNTGSTDIVALKYDPSGAVVWAITAGGNNSEDPYALSVDAQGNMFVGGQFRSANLAFGTFTLMNSDNGSSSDIFVAKINPPTGATSVTEQEIAGRGIFMWPNPVEGELRLFVESPFKRADVHVYDLKGKMFRSMDNVQAQRMTLEFERLPVGIYFLEMIAGSETRRVKFVVAGN